jgi:hypothetical protein
MMQFLCVIAAGCNHVFRITMANKSRPPCSALVEGQDDAGIRPLQLGVITELRLATLGLLVQTSLNNSCGKARSCSYQ